jgi:hypothetical protein
MAAFALVQAIVKRWIKLKVVNLNSFYKVIYGGVCIGASDSQAVDKAKSV